MKKLSLLFFVFIQINLYSQAQKVKDHFNIIIREVEGDLNNDGLTDKVLVKMDTINETQPLKLEIYFLQPNGKYKLNVSTKNLMEPQYPNGKYGGNQIPDFTIENGSLIMSSEIKGSEINRNHFLHTFKFKNGYFELQKISNVVWDGKNLTTETNFNLLTGERTEITKALGSEKIVKKITKKIIVKQLPTINDFRAFDSKLN
ncbi:hypothetical protein [Flavobacterium reichenbachii]|uniref:Uncharacterized protein n=1 Tax=Flavobacterium reichenbachii TaxID=362418 RepID=A0A085ZMV1_9FLAO|nr:hypothetical protein [Flavobacterium reichenbachii]KFF05765.1 hypothetical protein IW19_09640 [Flavobacterium reichenbachii]OXB12654.1 hypothetical protein B0A68_17850 [Flavobacterium reichenbachii]